MGSEADHANWGERALRAARRVVPRAAPGADSEEAVSEVVERLLKYGGEETTDEELRALAYKIARNWWFAEFRRHKRDISRMREKQARESRIDATEESTEDEREESETIQNVLREALQRIPLTDQRLVWLKYYGGRSLRQLEESSGIPASTLRRRLERTKAELWRELVVRADRNEILSAWMRSHLKEP